MAFINGPASASRGIFIRCTYLINSEANFLMWRNTERPEKFTPGTAGATADGATPSLYPVAFPRSAPVCRVFSKNPESRDI